MCGIFGYVTKNNEYDSRLTAALPVLAIEMDKRGGHSWGVTDGLDYIHKELGDMQEGWCPDYNGRPMFAGHTRFASTGAKVIENSHPFKIGDIIGMHNGIVYNHKELAEKFGYEYQVDSELIFKHMAAGRSLVDIRGYGAIQYFKGGKCFLGRFNHGELSIAKTDIGVVWASTEKAVKIACHMAGIAVEYFYQVEERKLFTITEGELFTTDVELDITYMAKGAKWSDGKEMTPTYTYNGYTGYGGYGSGGYGRHSKKHNKNTDKGGFGVVGGFSNSNKDSSKEPMCYCSRGPGKSEYICQNCKEQREKAVKLIQGAQSTTVIVADSNITDFVPDQHGVARRNNVGRKFTTTAGVVEIVRTKWNDACHMCTFMLDDYAWLTKKDGVLCDTCLEMLCDVPSLFNDAVDAADAEDAAADKEWAAGSQMWKTTAEEVYPSIRSVGCGFCITVMVDSDDVYTNLDGETLCTACFLNEIAASSAVLIEKPAILLPETTSTQTNVQVN